MKQSCSPYEISLDPLTEVFESAPDIAVNLLNKGYTVLWANKLMAVAVERPLNEMIGKPCYEVWRRRESPCPICLLNIVSEMRRPCITERWIDLPGKKRRFAEIRAYPVFGIQYKFLSFFIISFIEQRLSYLFFIQKKEGI